MRPRSTTASWKTTLLTLRACSGRSTTSWPTSAAVPLVGAIVVVSIPMVVDLPAPLGPSRPNTSPAATWKSIPFTASTPPRKVFLSRRTSTAGAARPLLCDVMTCSSSSLHRIDGSRRGDVTGHAVTAARAMPHVPLSRGKGHAVVHQYHAHEVPSGVDGADACLAGPRRAGVGPGDPGVALARGRDERREGHPDRPAGRGAAVLRQARLLRRPRRPSRRARTCRASRRSSTTSSARSCWARAASRPSSWPSTSPSRCASARTRGARR